MLRNKKNECFEYQVALYETSSASPPATQKRPEEDKSSTHIMVIDIIEITVYIHSETFATNNYHVISTFIVY